MSVTRTSTPPAGSQLSVYEQTGAHDPGHSVLLAVDLTFVENGKHETSFAATVTIGSSHIATDDSIVEFGPSGWTPVSATISNGTATFSITGPGVYAMVGPSGS